MDHINPSSIQKFITLNLFHLNVLLMFQLFSYQSISIFVEILPFNVKSKIAQISIYKSTQNCPKPK